MSAPLAQYWVSREVQRRRWINGGEDSIELDTLLSRVVISHFQTWLRDSFTDGEDTWRASPRTIGLPKWSEQELFSAGDGRSSATPTSGQESTRRDTKSSGGRISWVHEEPLGEHRVVERRPRPFVLGASGTVGLELTVKTRDLVRGTSQKKKRKREKKERERERERDTDGE